MYYIYGYLISYLNHVTYTLKYLFSLIYRQTLSQGVKLYLDDIIYAKLTLLAEL